MKIKCPYCNEEITYQAEDINAEGRVECPYCNMFVEV